MSKKTVAVLGGSIIGAGVGGFIMYKSQGKKLVKLQRECDKYLEMFLLLDTWLLNRNNEKKISDYLEKKGIQRVAIYGMGYVGKKLYEELSDEHIEIAYLIDKNKNIHIDDKFIKSPDEELDLVDAIIVTAIYDFEEVRDMMEERCSSPIISLSDIIYRM